MITKQNVLWHELIGLPATVVDARNPTHIGVTGTIIDETRGMVVIQTAEGVKKIEKRHTVFRLCLPDATVVDVEGSALEMRPEKRITARVRQ
ncbi:MAG TPA: ribonuclease P protein subunit [Methanomicrobiales archaeon]|nr:ribonuclease P protein subunit [Methanomicrobiales archaeon]